MNISIKTTLAILATGIMVQGCAAVGPAVGLLALGATKQNATKSVEWSSGLSRMNCTQMRSELVKLRKRGGALANMVPGNQSAAKISQLKIHMRQKRCRIPS